MYVFLGNNADHKIELNADSSAYDAALKLGIKNKAIAAKVNGELTDLAAKLSENDTIEIIAIEDSEALDILRHSTAHVLAMAIYEMSPDAQFAIGPVISDGFYYDISFQRTFSIDDLGLIEEKMRSIIVRKLKFEKSIISKQDAIKLFKEKQQNFKLEILEGIKDDFVSIYKLGDFIDLCRGPHIPNTSYIPVDAIKITSVAGAYWRGDSSKAMLQRLYGTAFFTKKELKDHLNFIEEAKLRDHRKLGQELEIFHIDDCAPGNIFWLPNGCVIFNLIKDYLTQTIRKYGYSLVQTPQLVNRSLWETSGHWEKFQENMFVVHDEDTTMAIKPMNCPGHIIIYTTGSVKSYKDLPVRLAEFGLCHRNESSGSLHGLMRLRAFMQDDGHVFCRQDQIIAETQNISATLKEVYAAFGFTDISVKFSDRPEKRAGSDEIWDIAEKSLMIAAKESGLEYTLNKGEGAFYGPKLEFTLKDCLGREWQCGTVQVDFVLPQRFNISYVDTAGKKQTPVLLHRALVGSLERFIGILIEHYAGKFPFWLAPIQIAIASITDDSTEYAREIQDILDKTEFRTALDVENEKINYKIRQHSVKKIPAIVIVGKREQDERTVGVRLLGSEKTETVSVSKIQEYFDNLKIGPK
ncbi:MAG: threonine--tRNA ligase [Holosporaceae bacterium]|jgi:threonyl-tRNA synthetase|nr:threonine--tRNA ligase [Holosporaceae bacterium]